MPAYQYVYHLDGLTKIYPGGKKVFENIRLHFLPDAKIGIVGVNGSGKYRRQMPREADGR